MSLDHVKLHLVEDWNDARNFMAWLESGPMQHGVMGVDTETTGLSIVHDRVRMAQLGDLNEGWAFPCEGADAWTGLFADALRRFQGTMKLHNAPYDYAMLNKLGITLDRRRIEDTRIKAHIMEPDKPTALKSQTSRHIDPRAASAQHELDQAIKKHGWGGVSLRFGPYWHYAALDPVLTCHLDVHHSAGLPPYAFEVENAVQFVLETMMRRGVTVDLDFAREKRATFTSFCEKAAQWCWDEFGVRPGSNAAVVRVLREAGHEFTKGTASGAVALDKEVLGEIDHPLARTVLKHRQISKLTSTYLDYYLAHATEGRITPSINSVGARTGRMSSSEPNFQNLPRVSEQNKAATAIRNCVVARPDHLLVFCDFSQIETRLLAHLSQDPGLIAAFRSPEDFFVVLARTIFQDASIGKKDPRRNIIKTLVYAKIYGAGIAKMAKTLGLPESQMRSIDDALNASYPGIKSFQQRVYTEAMQNKRDTGTAFIVCPLSGRRHPADPGKEYALVNYLIQGMAAFFFKMKLLELDAAGLGDYLILPVHDEIIADVPRDAVPDVVSVLRRVMNDDQVFSVPVQAEVSYGERWGEKKDYVLIG